MKNAFLIIGCAILLFSCKEQPIAIDLGNYDNWDTSYQTTVQPAQDKNYLLEELTGVRCANCPEGAMILNQLNDQNGGKFVIVGLNTGALTAPIKERSIQDFRTEAGDQIRTLIFGGEGNKPAVSFDRLPLSKKQNKYFVESSTNWGEAIVQMKNHATTTPVNVKVSSKHEPSEDRYNIEVEIHFTKEVRDTLALHIFLTENDIKDAFIDSDTLITYNHVFRDALTPPTGRTLAKLEAVSGTTYVYRTSFSIDRSHAKEQFWKPENMDVVAFVSKGTPQDKSVLQVAKTTLLEK